MLRTVATVNYGSNWHLVYWRRMRTLSIRPALALALAAAAAFALAAMAPPPAEAATPAAVAAAETFDPVAFFSGATEGRGQLKKVMSAAQKTHATGFGTLRRDGTMVIDQRVVITGEPVTTRQWLLRPAGPGRFAGTYSDTPGPGAMPVAASVSGPRLTMRYSMPGKLSVEQVMTLAPGGQSARNVMKIRKFGIVVATLDETIRRV